MKSIMKALAYGLIFALVLGYLALTAVVRLAPSDPKVWNVAITGPDAPVAGPCTDQIKIVPKGARATCLMSADPVAVLTKLNAVALATTRTTLLAGSPVDGRITWISRSKLMGYPDYITAETSQTPAGTRLDIFSRQRFGTSDWGVNAARLKLWLSTLDQG